MAFRKQVKERNEVERIETCPHPQPLSRDGRGEAALTPNPSPSGRGESSSWESRVECIETLADPPQSPLKGGSAG